MILRGKMIITYGLISWLYSITVLILSLYFLPDSFAFGETVIQTYGLLWFSFQLILLIVFLNNLYRKEGKVLWWAFIFSVWLVYIIEDSLFHLTKHTVFRHEFQPPELKYILKSLVIVSGMMTVIGGVKVWQLKTGKTATAILLGIAIMGGLGMLVRFLSQF